MKGKFKKLIEKRYFVVILILLLMMLVGAAGTYAWFTWSSTSNTSLTMTIKDVGDVIFSGGPDINTNDLSPVFNYSDGKETSIQIINKNTTENAIFTISINITTLPTELKNESLKYAIVNVDNNNEVVDMGDFSQYNAGNSYLLYSNDLPSGTSNYKFFIYIDANIENNLNMMNKTFAATIVVGGEEKNNNPYFINHITNMYNFINTTSNNGITYKLDDLDKLMKDQDGNIRYYGASPNNYVYFNCSNYTNQSSSNCEIWRIIGIVDGKIKLIRNTPIREATATNNYIAGLAWDLDVNINGNFTYNNDWTNSSLGALLNISYYNGDTVGTVIYYSSTNGRDTVDTSINFYNEGIRNNATRELISESTWYLRSVTSSNYPDQAYNNERNNGSLLSGRQPTIQASVGLAYLSDYGYAADLSKCQNKELYLYSDSTCTSNNWMRNIMLSDSWLLALDSTTLTTNFIVNSNGAVQSGAYGYVYLPLTVNPVIHLYDNVKIDLTKGDGSQNRPYQIITG